MKRLSKKIAVLCGITLCALLVFTTNGLTVAASGNDVVETNDARSTNLEWIYKEINGEMYMRLWNHSTGQWATDWIPAVYPS